MLEYLKVNQEMNFSSEFSGGGLILGFAGPEINPLSFVIYNFQDKPLFSCFKKTPSINFGSF